MLWHAVNSLAFVSSLLFIIDACIITSKPRGRIPLPQSVSMINSSPQQSPWPTSIDATFATSTSHFVKTTPPFSLRKSVHEIKSSRLLSSSITPTSTTVIPSPTVSTNITICMDEEPAQNKKLDAKKGNGEDLLKVKRGQLTFDAEGNDKKGNRFFSRVPHVPTSSSGITLGRGYDLKHRSEKQVLKDLQNAGIPKLRAEKFAKGVGLKGKKAKKYLKKNGIEKCLLTHEQQKKLFDIAYKKEAAEAKRIATKPDVEKAYGETDWDKLNDAIKDVVVDLKFRGDYKPETRKKIQAAIASNDLKRFTELMSDRDYWVKQIGVPKDRFERRKAFLEKAKQ